MVNSTHLNFLFRVLLKTYFFNSRCIFIFTDPFNNVESRPEIPTIYIKDVIIHHENASDLFIQFEKLIRVNNERFNTRRYIVSGKKSMDVFNTKELEHVSNLLVVVPNVNESYNMVTHVYGKSTKVVLDTWFSQNYSFRNGYDLFPDKLYNQNGRTLRVGTFTYEPYAIVGENNETFAGTETYYVLELAKKHNLTLSFTIIEDQWGDIYENWTGVGVLGSLLDDNIDIGYAAIYMWEDYYKFLDYSKPTVRTGVTCMVPAPRLAAGWLTPLLSFSMDMWLAVLLVLLFDTVVLVFLLYRDRNPQYFSDSVMTMVQLYLLQSLSIPIHGKVLKYFIALNMINVLLLSSSYGSGLSSVMTIPRYEKPIKTVEDLALSGLPWGADTDAWLISLRHVHEEDYKTIKKQFVVKTEENLLKSSKLHNFGFTLERLPYGHYAVPSYIKGDIIANYRIMQDIYWEECIFAVRKNSVLLPLLDDLILRVFEAGLAGYWENQVVSQYMDMSVQRGIMYYIHNVQEHETIKLKWFHVEGAFAILLIGYIVSGLAFSAEIITLRLRTHT